MRYRFCGFTRGKKDNRENPIWRLEGRISRQTYAEAPSSPGSRPRKLPWRSNSVSCGQLAASCPKRKRSIDPLVAWFLLLAFLFVFHSRPPFCWFLSLACCFLPLLPFLSCCCFVPCIFPGGLQSCGVNFGQDPQKEVELQPCCALEFIANQLRPSNRAKTIRAMPFMAPGIHDNVAMNGSLGYQA